MPQVVEQPKTSVASAQDRQSTFAHPLARYFAVGRIGRDQVESYAERAGMTVGEAERWLAPNLAYEPEPAAVA